MLKIDPMSRALEGEKNRHGYLDYIDCIRGYAILMVIICHYTYCFDYIPYPVKMITRNGWYGVQLFFIASSVTLLMSWNSETEKYGKTSGLNFFIRRFFRIAPAYYFAGMVYFFTISPGEKFSWLQVFSYMTFTNAWHPVTMSTISGGWSPVPGGWSIGVEFSFYFIFPIFAAFAASMSRALMACFFSVVFGLFANILAEYFFYKTFSISELSNFLFFWFPNQFFVFSLGAVAFFAIRGLKYSFRLRVTPLISAFFALMCLIVFLLFALLPGGHYIGDGYSPPSIVLISLPLAAFVIVMSFSPAIFVNKIVMYIGKVSFSCYLFHWLVLDVFSLFPDVFHTEATEYHAIAAFMVGLPVVLCGTFLLGWLSYVLIEKPMIGLGRKIVARRQHSRIRRADPGRAVI